MTTRGSKKKSATRGKSKPVIGHDPLALGAEDSAEVEEVATKSKASVPTPTKKVAKKKVAKKKASRKKAVAQGQSAANLEEREMTESGNDKAAGGSFELGGSLTIAEVADMYQQFIELLEKGDAVSLDASEVENIDGAGLQLLTAFVKEGRQRNVEISWEGISDAVQEGSSQLGLQTALGLSAAS